MAGLLLAVAVSSPVAASVLVAQIHGADQKTIDRFLIEKELPASGALARLARKGVRARYVAPVNPALTSTARVTMLTGAYPAAHGIVANSFRRAGEGIETSTSGFSSRFSAETIWEAAERQGRQVIRIGSLFMQGSQSEPAGDRLFGTGRLLAPSVIAELRPKPGQSWRLGDQRAENLMSLGVGKDLEPIKIKSAAARIDVALNAVALDTSADGRKSFDTLVLDSDLDLGNGSIARLKGNQWVAIAPLPGSPGTGSWAKLLGMEESGRARLYIGALHSNRGYPSEFVGRIEHAVGFYPGAPDYSAVQDGRIDEGTWLEQVERENRFFRDAALAAMKLEPFDLMIFEQPGIDNVVHQFLLSDPRQEGYDAEGGDRRARYKRHIARIYRTIDDNLSAVMAALDAGSLTLATSDYSILPVHARYDVNAILARAGFRVTADATTQVRAIASSTSAFIYIEPSVTRHEREAQVARMRQLFRELRHPTTGEPIFQDVLTPREQKKRKIASALTAGDLWIRAHPGFALTSRRAELWKVNDAPALRGEHGFAVEASNGAGMFGAWRTGIANATTPPICAVDVAAAISSLLGIEPPNGSTGDAVRVRQLVAKIQGNTPSASPGPSAHVGPGLQPAC